MAATSNIVGFPTQRPQQYRGTVPAPLYGAIKLHKEGLSIPPIVADPDNALDTIPKALNPVLKLLIKQAQHEHTINNSTQLIQCIEAQSKQKGGRLHQRCTGGGADGHTNGGHAEGAMSNDSGGSKKCYHFMIG